MDEVSKLVNSQYSDLEKKKLKEIINIIIGLSNKAHREGLLSLEDDYPFLPYFLLREGIELIVEATHPDEVTSRLNQHINTKERSDIEQLEMILIRDGVLLLQSGEKPRRLFDEMILIVGEDVFEGFRYEDLEGVGM